MFGNDVLLENIDFFRHEIVTGMDNLHTELTDEFKTMTASVWDDHQLEIKPYDTLFEDIAGCTEQCPFCKEQCEYTKATHPDSILHSAKHRPQCLGGYHWNNDNTMILDVCTFLVASEKKFRNEDTKQKFRPYSKYSNQNGTSLRKDPSKHQHSGYGWLVISQNTSRLTSITVKQKFIVTGRA